MTNQYSINFSVLDGKRVFIIDDLDIPTSQPATPPSPIELCVILQENGCKFLQENGCDLLTEFQVTI